MTCNLDTGHDFIEVQNINAYEDYDALAKLLNRHSYLITRIDNMETVTDGDIYNIHVHIRHSIFAPYVIHLIKKYLNI
jgi:hypothetical protein